MTEAAVLNKLISLIKCLFKGLCLIHSKNGRKLFVSKLFGKLYALNLTNEDLCTCGNCHACELCDLRSSLTNDLCVECAVDDDGLTNLFGLHRIEETAASCRKLTLYGILDMLKDALEAGADIIMLDNMTVEDMKKAVELCRGKAETECSGNVTRENVARLVDIGVDYISSGALTHSSPILDLSLKNLHAI